MKDINQRTIVVPLKLGRTISIALVAIAPLLARAADSWEDLLVQPDLTPKVLATDASSTALYAAGEYFFGDGRSAAAVSKYDEAAQAWVSKDIFVPPQGTGARYYGLCNSGDSLFAAGIAFGSSSRWLVRRSIVGDADWLTADEFRFAPNLPSEAWAVAANGRGSVFVAGDAPLSANGSAQWVVRQSSDAGATWRTAEVAPGGNSRLNSARAVAIHPTGAVFVAGQLSVKNGPLVWTVRRSIDGGDTWTTVDSFQAIKGGESGASGVAFDSTGAIYVAGRAHVPVGRSSAAACVVRKSINGGALWNTVEVFRAPSGEETITTAFGRVITIDPVDNVYLSVRAGAEWYVRAFSSATGVWHTSDHIFGSPASLTHDASGRIFAGGTSDGPLVRVLP